LNSYFFVYPYQERSTKAFLLLCGRLFYPLEDEWTMVFELSLIRSAFKSGVLPYKQASTKGICGKRRFEAVFY
ncbi:MAG: hypothetical protein PUK25_00790, partial [Clostridiales bacterium]|nr:hypothetical protein [Clostridiales bacterium]MDD7688369.1 hypothetical protein [Clostridiales bacterium]MDY5702453.1 hypothetical protein [Eubacteriales bacterium]